MFSLPKIYFTKKLIIIAVLATADCFRGVSFQNEIIYTIFTNLNENLSIL